MKVASNLSSPRPQGLFKKRVGCMPAFFLLMCCPCLVPAQTQQTPPEDVKPEPVRTTITVSEKITAETPASVRVVDSLEIQRSPGVNLDDRLRNVPGFSLFRRSSSLVANPTTQGISLRGI